MPRDVLRALKKAMHAGDSKQAPPEQREEAAMAALALLERSVRMRHRRLAVQGLGRAVALAAPITEAQWRYCRQAAEASRDAAIRSLFEQLTHVVF